LENSYKLKLSATMIVFTLVISIVLTISNYVHLRDEALNHELDILNEKANLLIYALETSEKANIVINDNLEARMRNTTNSLMKLYESTHSFDEWDFAKLSSQYRLDIFIINNQNKIIYSNVDHDIGLDFNQCCGKLVKTLEERRASGKFYADGLDVEQATGAIKKYSYMSTADKDYIIQLGFTWTNETIFEQFNFLYTAENIRRSHPSILDINVLNIGGLSLGKSEEEYFIRGEQRAAFERTLSTHESTMLDSTWNGEEAIYLYVHYLSPYDTGTTQSKVLEIVYSKEELIESLTEQKKIFILRILSVLVVTVILAIFISRWIAKPIYLAFHDSLTNLGNRAYFEKFAGKNLKANPIAFTLLMIDMDNFKKVNDTFGHDHGDKLLKKTADIMRNAVTEDETIFRMGGDEFIIVSLHSNRARAEQIARQLIDSFNEQISSEYSPDIMLSLSIGIAIAPIDGIDVDTLTNKADIALYDSKKSGKNQYALYDQEHLRGNG